MRGKKKASQAPSIDKQPQNKLKNIITNDGKQYKIMDSILIKYSGFIRTFLEDEKGDDDIRLLQIDGEAMEYLIKFLDLHKDKEPQKISYPLKSNQDPRYIMEEGDAELVISILETPDNFSLFKKVLDASTYFQLDQFKKRLLAGLTIRLLKTTVSELKEELQISDYEVSQEQLRKECRERLEHISDMKDD